MTRVIIADDHTLIRRALAMLMKADPEIELVAEAADGVALQEVLKKHEADVLLLDIEMPNLNGLGVLRNLDKSLPKMRTLIMSMHPEGIYGVNVRRMGAKGYTSKNDEPETIMAAIKAVAAGNEVFNDDLYKFNRHGFIPQIKLSKRETQVLNMLVSGLSNKIISQELKISDKTVSTYKLRLLRKLNANSVVDLVKYTEMNQA